MTDLISRQDAINALLEKGQRSRRYKLGEIWELNFDEIREALATVPSAYPKKGKWMLWNEPGNEHAWCTACNAKFDQDDLYIGGNEYPKFCPECGADMREES